MNCASCTSNYPSLSLGAITSDYPYALIIISPSITPSPSASSPAPRRRSPAPPRQPTDLLQQPTPSTTTVSSSSYDAPIGGLMSTTEVIARLGDHGCPNITDRLDLASCSAYPISRGGFGEVYRGRLHNGSQVAIKTMWIKVNTDEAQKPLKVHGDLKGQNVLISGDGTPMLTDFGNAVLQESTLQFTTTTTKANISPRWTAPELMEGVGMHSFAADVYALGMTILETVTGDLPYSGKSEHGVYLAVAVKKEPPVRPEDSIPSNSEDGNKLWSLLTTCWVYDPENRPSAGDVQNTMETITQGGLKVVQAKEVDEYAMWELWNLKMGVSDGLTNVVD
ncbi:kinase-like protein [Ceratobasidium sp. AG-I]|nr:kinase-like protein [Ceratobasidium sp. AG-I]